MTGSNLPSHLKRYVVNQDYSHYTAEDQAVWRFIMRNLNDFLSKNAHPCYSEGLKKTGISLEKIPNIEEMNSRLSEFGWGAVAVSGFIPPAAFMEFQSRSILPIASDMRSLQHLNYTPAPDIVHEAAGHAPIIVDPEYSAYLKKYAKIASHAIISKQDLEQYQAIRELSDIKEHPESTPEQIALAEENLIAVNERMNGVSEAAILARMNWWTAEYGLVGDLKRPKIYGAGLLSSVGESRQYLSPKVKRLPMSIECIDYAYNITEPQPQLFVTESFAELSQILDDLSKRMAFTVGGTDALLTARRSQLVNTVVFESGLEVSGVLSEILTQDETPYYLRFSGPCQLAKARRQLTGHGPEVHYHGFGMPLGSLKESGKRLSSLTEADCHKLGWREGQTVEIHFQSGVKVKGVLKDMLFNHERLMLLNFGGCTVSDQKQILFAPEWGTYDLAAGSEVLSVFAGPSDREQFPTSEDFVASRVKRREFTRGHQNLLKFYEAVRTYRENFNAADETTLTQLAHRYQTAFSDNWLLGVELLELAVKLKNPAVEKSLAEHLARIRAHNPSAEESINDGMRLQAV